ncbi:MAG: acetylglutamate kinase [Methyloligellaceae bacterium]
MNKTENSQLPPKDKAQILSEALPHMQQYDKQTLVIKFGGHAMSNPQLSEDFAKDVVMLKQLGIRPIIVHGGGPQIGKLLDKLEIKSEFSGGLRITDAATVDVVEMVLAGSINKSIVSAINKVGGRACGISGKDGNLMLARKFEKVVRDPESDKETNLDLGFVGEPEKVDTRIVDVITGSDLIPVIAPIGGSVSGQTYNINADTFAGALASALKAKRLLLLTDVPGVLDKKQKLIQRLTIEETEKLIIDNTISGGMIPKVESCMSVVQNGVEAVVIMDGRVKHALLLELFTEHGAGTMFTR